MDSQYKAYLLERYHDEVAGESFFRTLSEHATDPDRNYKWQVLTRLETETQELLRSALKELELEVAPRREDIERGQREATRFSAIPWIEFMKGFRPVLQNFVHMFEAAESLAPDVRDRTLLQHVTAHERALLAFVTRELEGCSDASLQPVLTLLENPPRRF
ncbi:hypothetical protein HNQ60_004713 [Povalibacter uvarum]|uniref:Uncharacterized protein n=1 Tax=Povalibacter uvarum TaxID=732238 RepID=A0A841HV29_9GAMM|nr:hypothetical protein [Povalibacter uvarum]MBB6095822.1 hypothetical protein [Povalibacter uvarum]